MVAPDDCPSQAEYIKYFDDAIAVMQTEAALERIAYELCVDSAAENIDYLEVRWAPRLQMRQGLTIEQVIEAVLSGLESGPIHAVAIVCAMRHHTPEDNVALAREAGRFAGRGVATIRAHGQQRHVPAVRRPRRPAGDRHDRHVQLLQHRPGPHRMRNHLRGQRRGAGRLGERPDRLARAVFVP